MSTKQEPKKFNLTDEERSELMFYAREHSVRQMETQFWAIRMDEIRNRILTRCGLDPKAVEVTWKEALESGSIEVNSSKRNESTNS